MYILNFNFKALRLKKKNILNINRNKTNIVWKFKYYNVNNNSVLIKSRRGIENV